MNYTNSWDNDTRSASYARLEFPNTYHLAYRDLPEIIGEHTSGKKALDFGCGTGRSTRFLKNLGYKTTGIDISASMVSMAKQLDPEGDYHIVKDGDYDAVGNNYDLILSIFTFDNIPDRENRAVILGALKNLLGKNGCIIMLDANPEMYTREWASFTTHNFPENGNAKSGQVVKICMSDVEDQSPVEDYLWMRQDYEDLFAWSELNLIADYAPLGYPEEPFEWKSELTVPPWFIYVLKPIK